MSGVRMVDFCVTVTVTGPFKQSTEKDRSLPSHSHTGSLEPTPEPVESQSSSGQTRRTASEPIRRPCQPHHMSGAKLKVASDGSLDNSRVKKPKSGSETYISVCV